MQDLIKAYFQDYNYLQLKDIATILRCTAVKSFKTGEIIAQRGSVYPYSLGIINGMIRTYITTPDGVEKTVRFAEEKDFTACSRCFLFGKPSNEYLQALEDTRVFAIQTEKLRNYAYENPRLLRFINDAMAKALMDSVERIEFFASLSPQERYEDLLIKNPKLIHRVAQKYLASYIGVTTVSLSRIRSRIGS